MPTFKKSKNTLLDTAITNLLTEITSMKVENPQYANALTQLEKLHAMKATEKSSRVDNNTLVLAGANLVGIALIIGYESKNVITSKALMFLGKLK